MQNGVYAEISAVRRRNLIDGERMPLAQLAEIAGEFGLEARLAHFEWQSLLATPFSHPFLLVLDNGNAIVLLGIRRGVAETAAEEVAISDPLFQEGEPFFLSREALERAWSGAAVIVSPLAQARRTPISASPGSPRNCSPSGG